MFIMLIIFPVYHKFNSKSTVFNESCFQRTHTHIYAHTHARAHTHNIDYTVYVFIKMLIISSSLKTHYIQLIIN